MIWSFDRPAILDRWETGVTDGDGSPCPPKNLKKGGAMRHRPIFLGQREPSPVSQFLLSLLFEECQIPGEVFGDIPEVAGVAGKCGNSCGQLLG